MNDPVTIPVEQIWVDDTLIAYRIRLTNELPRHAKNQPLLVQRTSEKLRLIGGHRMFRRNVSSGAAEISATVTDEADEYTIRVLHLAHAVHCEGLTHLEIANGIHHTFTRGETVEQIGTALNRLERKIEVYQRLYGLPKETKAVIEANDDELTVEDLDCLVQLKRRSFTHFLKLVTTRPITKQAGSRRPAGEMNRVISQSIEVCGGNNPYARALMWATYNLSDDQKDRDLQDERNRISAERDRQQTPH